jgi:hypothetical protein
MERIVVVHRKNGTSQGLGTLKGGLISIFVIPAKRDLYFAPSMRLL